MRTIKFDSWALVVFLRLPPILTKLLDRSPNWVNPSNCPKGQMGQIWGHMGQKPDRGRSRKYRSSLEGKWGLKCRKLSDLTKIVYLKPIDYSTPKFCLISSIGGSF